MLSDTGNGHCLSHISNALSTEVVYVCVYIYEMRWIIFCLSFHKQKMMLRVSDCVQVGGKMGRTRVVV